MSDLPAEQVIEDFEVPLRPSIDINGDGYEDVFDWLSSEITLGPNGTEKIKLENAKRDFRADAFGGNDLNGDGMDDMLFSGQLFPLESYVIFGRRDYRLDGQWKWTWVCDLRRTNFQRKRLWIFND